MSSYYRHLIEDGYLLDIYPNAAAAYSLRKLRDGYTGPLFAVRRSVDNALLDVFPNSQGTFDETVLLDWVGYNLFTFSEEINNGVWGKVNTSAAAGTVLAPDGTSTGDIVFETITNSTHELNRNFSVINGQNYTISFWVKPNGRDFIRIVTPSTLSHNPGTAGVAWIDLTNGTIISQNSGFTDGPSNLTVVLDTNGWYKISYTMPATTTASIQAFRFDLSPDGTTLSYVGNTSLGVAVWGVQISETPDLKPYQRTGTTAGGEGTIQTWYDQSGVNAHTSQLTASAQPRIVNRNKVEVRNNKPSIVFNGTNQFLIHNTQILSSSNTLIICVDTVINAGASGNAIFDSANNQIFSSSNGLRFDNFQNNFRFGTLSTFTTNSATANNVQRLRSGVATATSRSIFTQGVLRATDLGNFVPTFTGVTQHKIGAMTNGTNQNSGVNFYGGGIQEIIIWQNGLETLRSNIEQEINNYYGIY
jgi:hypothetical protein